MKKLAAFVAITFLISCSSNDPYKKLDKLSGLWSMNTDQGPLYEEWSKQANNSMYGKSYMINDGDSIVFETVQLKKQDDGVFYIPTVKENNNQPVSFKLISHDSAFVFENKAHDFPQRVIYKFIGRDSIMARIEGKKNGEEMSQEFYYGRVKKP